VFIVRPEQYEKTLQRHPDVAKVIKTTFGSDGDNFNESIGQADALVTFRFPRKALREHAGKLQWIQALAAGIDSFLPLDWLPAGVQITTNSGAHTPKAAESALMAILMVNARIPTLVTMQKEHKWNRIFTSTVEGKTLLVVGVGHIGGAIADIARKAGMRVLGIRRSLEAHPSVEQMHGPDDLLSVLPKADIVVLSTALTSKTKFLMNEAQFAAMKAGAGFINMSRGELVNPEALIQALKSGHVSSAVIDVTYPEPLPPESVLFDAPNLIIAPHVLSDDIDQYVPRTLDIFFENIRRHIAGKALRNLVDVQKEY
jgi:phosphoglycerate dehydrogenase-like enzyme